GVPYGREGEPAARLGERVAAVAARARAGEWAAPVAERHPVPRDGEAPGDRPLPVERDRVAGAVVEPDGPGAAQEPGPADRRAVGAVERGGRRRGADRDEHDRAE